MAGRVIGRTVLAVAGLLLIVLAWRLLAPISTPAFRGRGGEPLPRSIAVVERWPVNGVTNSVIIRGRDRNNPILLFLH